MPVLVRTAAAIEDLLRRGLTPVTDNADALMTLGFERAYPQVRTGYDSTIWERTLEIPQAYADGRRRLARQRALLEVSSARKYAHAFAGSSS